MSRRRRREQELTQRSLSLLRSTLRKSAACWRVLVRVQIKACRVLICLSWVTEEADCCQSRPGRERSTGSSSAQRHSTWQLVCGAYGARLLSVLLTSFWLPSRRSCLPLKVALAYPCDDSCDSSRQKNGNGLPSARATSCCSARHKTLPADAVDVHFARETRALHSSRLGPNESRKNLQP